MGVMLPGAPPSPGHGQWPGAPPQPQQPQLQPLPQHHLAPRPRSPSPYGQQQQPQQQQQQQYPGPPPPGMPAQLSDLLSSLAQTGILQGMPAGPRPQDDPTLRTTELSPAFVKVNSDPGRARTPRSHSIAAPSQPRPQVAPLCRAPRCRLAPACRLTAALACLARERSPLVVQHRAARRGSTAMISRAVPSERARAKPESRASAEVLLWSGAWASGIRRGAPRPAGPDARPFCRYCCKSGRRASSQPQPMPPTHALCLRRLGQTSSSGAPTCTQKGAPTPTAAGAPLPSLTDGSYHAPTLQRGQVVLSRNLLWPRGCSAAQAANYHMAAPMGL
jgi:hypothetical protein